MGLIHGEGALQVCALFTHGLVELVQEGCIVPTVRTEGQVPVLSVLGPQKGHGDFVFIRHSPPGKARFGTGETLGGCVVRCQHDDGGRPGVHPPGEIVGSHAGRVLVHRDGDIVEQADIHPGVGILGVVLVGMARLLHAGAAAASAAAAAAVAAVAAVAAAAVAALGRIRFSFHCGSQPVSQTDIFGHSLNHSAGRLNFHGARLAFAQHGNIFARDYNPIHRAVLGQRHHGVVGFYIKRSERTAGRGKTAAQNKGIALDRHVPEGCRFADALTQVQPAAYHGI